MGAEEVVSPFLSYFTFLISLYLICQIVVNSAFMILKQHLYRIASSFALITLLLLARRKTQSSLIFMQDVCSFSHPGVFLKVFMLTLKR